MEFAGAADMDGKPGGVSERINLSGDDVGV
jgi:hypothetical protein